MVRKFSSLDAGFGSECGVYVCACVSPRGLTGRRRDSRERTRCRRFWAGRSCWTRATGYGNLDDIFAPPTYDCVLPPAVLNATGPPLLNHCVE